MAEIERHLRRGPTVYMAILDGVLAQFEPHAEMQTLRQHRDELATIEREIRRLVKAIAASDELEPLVKELRARQARRNDLRATIATYGSGVQRFDRGEIERAVRQEFGAWRTLLASEDVAEGRRLLRKGLGGPILFSPMEGAYQFTGTLAYGAMLAGRVELPPFVVPVRGFEPRFDG